MLPTLLAVVLTALLAAAIALTLSRRRKPASEHQPAALDSKAETDAPRAEPDAEAGAPVALADPEAVTPKADVVAIANQSLRGDDDDEVEFTLMGAIPLELLDPAKVGRHGDDGRVDVPDDEPWFDVELEDAIDETAEDVPTGAHALILVTGTARSDRGKVRVANEDCYLVLPQEFLYVVADGMGGHAAGDVASGLAVEVIGSAFSEQIFEGEPNRAWPRRGDELVRSIRMANEALFARAQSDAKLGGMGTTIVAARFTPNKQRVYIAHVGDSRCYRIRNESMYQLTIDHTVGTLLGIKGKKGAQLSRAVGVKSSVEVDLNVDEPRPNDLYVLCSDGLTKMVPDDLIRTIATQDNDLERNAVHLVEEANRRGGRDNITVVLVRVQKPDFSSMLVES